MTTLKIKTASQVYIRNFAGNWEALKHSRRVLARLGMAEAVVSIISNSDRNV